MNKRLKIEVMARFILWRSPSFVEGRKDVILPLKLTGINWFMNKSHFLFLSNKDCIIFSYFFYWILNDFPTAVPLTFTSLSSASCITKNSLFSNCIILSVVVCCISKNRRVHFFINLDLWKKKKSWT